MLIRCKICDYTSTGEVVSDFHQGLAHPRDFDHLTGHKELEDGSFLCAYCASEVDLALEDFTEEPFLELYE